MKGVFVPLNDEEAEQFMNGLQPSTPGALPAGTRIRKVRADETDLHQDGALGKVVSSILVEPEAPIFGYMILWDDMSIPVFIAGHRIEPV